MTYAEFENLLLLADRMTVRCESKKAEYWRGYCSGINFHFQNGMPESLPDHYSIMDAARRNGSNNVHAYARGYRDGCKGLKPEDTHRLSRHTPGIFTRVLVETFHNPGIGSMGDPRIKNIVIWEREKTDQNAV